MNKATKEQRKQYREFRRNLPRSPGISDAVGWLTMIASAVFDHDHPYHWLDIKTVHDVCLRAKLRDAKGPVELHTLKSFFEVLFKRQDRLFFDRYEIWSGRRVKAGEEGLEPEPVYCFQHHEPNCEADLDYLVKLKQEVHATGMGG